MIIIETILLFHDMIRQDEKLLIRELSNAGARYELINTGDHLELPGEPRRGLAFPRTISQRRTQLVAQINEALGNQSINSLVSIIMGNNKAATMAALSRLGLPIPRSIVINAGADVDEVAEKLGFPIIVKPIQGSWGRMVGLANGVQDLAMLARHGSASSGSIVAQEFIDKPGRDIRITVVGGEAVAAIYRYSPGDDWRTNTARGGRAEAAKLSPELEDIGVKSAEAIKASYAGVDVVESRDGYKVLEVNVVPEFKNVMRVTGVNVARRIVDLLMLAARRGA
ncbi:lysine biosynthesis enzyme LysX [Thermocladium modestius]|uniref:Lysine biosynthesis enzyme LysX n=1 Tax=Thermocladium modestius TaxID=62609 RepID=A0A830GW68_9CREN|nr:lysine biosynthesis protein LysX [Thermocladium modestius]GGP20890.1 lysine biosynthesis enzyme LysX [Thermocladium modestius]